MAAFFRQVLLSLDTDEYQQSSGKAQVFRTYCHKSSQQSYIPLYIALSGTSRPQYSQDIQYSQRDIPPAKYWNCL